MLDLIRVTEEGAEAIALVLAGSDLGWTVRRRLQRGEAADWLLQDREGQLVALEISGIDGQFSATRLSQKVDQASRATVAIENAACVVAFELPEAVMDSL